MTVCEHVPFASLTTLRVGGPARFVVDVTGAEDASDAIAFAQESGLPWRVLGQGSNVLASDDGFGGVTLLMREQGIRYERDGATALATCAAGVSWDAFVEDACARGLWGLENLAGIPGTVGACPVQNIGAYGSEVADTIEVVRALDTGTAQVRELPTEACGFGYRTSRFKQEPELLILSVAFRLRWDGASALGYKDLAAARDSGEDLSTPSRVADAVRRIRSAKFPDLAAHGTAGSFWKNPTLPRDRFELLRQTYPEIPGYPNEGGVKVPLAFALDRILGLRGHREGNVSLFARQPLVLVSHDGATASDIDRFADNIASRASGVLGVPIEREVRAFPNA